VGVVASLDALPDLGAPFDVVCCTHVLYHVDDPGAALDALACVLGPGGTLVVSTICDDDLPEVNALTRAAYGHDPVAPLHARFGADVAEGLIRARFAAVARHDFHDVYAIRDADLLAGHVLSIPPGPDLSTTERERVRALAADRIAGAGGTLRSARRQALFTARAN
jgi:SAM-dependent methyltransferase